MKTIATMSALVAAMMLAACSSTTDGTKDTITKRYGPAQNVGNGQIRTYIITEEKDPSIPLEVGLSMSEGVMNNLPVATSMTGMAGMDHTNMAAMMNMNMYLLDLPSQNPTPYKFVQFDWNPVGHEPAGVYDLPHFDFHFYTVTLAVRNSILPTDPNFATKAASFPAESLRAPFHLDAATLGQVAPALATVPEMGLHWLDVRSPELQGLGGHPEAFKPFTKTFIYGSWDGQFIFDEPMITKAYLLAKHDTNDPAVRDELIPVSTAAHYSPAGYYPGAYRITYDAQAKEYRVALTQLSAKN
ncbi:MAG TPA: hypothetical protein VGM82_08635 [Gemmatimonadaceae bacterium]|jgi:hypothetical protein